MILNGVASVFMILSTTLLCVSASAQERVHLEKIFSPETSEYAPIIGLPGHVAVIGDTVYVSDKLAFKVYAYSKSGKYLYSLGERGRGPGELQDITDMFSTGDGSLVVTDWRNRRVNRFSVLSDTLVQEALIVSNRQYVRNVFDTKLGWIMGTISLSSETGANMLFHLLEPGNGQIGVTDSFGGIPRDLYSDSFVRRLISARVGSIIEVSNDELWYYPRFYSARRKYIYRPADSSWERVDLDSGKQSSSSPFRIVKEPPFEKGYVSASAAETGIAIYSDIYGAWKVKGSSVYHMYYDYDSESRSYYLYLRIEDLDEGDQGDTFIISEIDSEGPNNVPYPMAYPVYVSEEGTIYMIEYGEDGVSEVFGYQIDID